jgi:hypothetical protein
MRLLSPRILPIIILVMLPVLTSILSIVLSSFVPIIASYTLGKFIYTYSYLYIASALTLAYAFYPIKLSTIKKRGFVELSSEYEYIKKILYFEVPILIVSTFFFIGSSYPIGPYDRSDFRLFLGQLNEPLGLGTYPITVTIVDIFGYGKGVEVRQDVQEGLFLNYFLPALSINLGLSVTAGIIFMVLVTARKEFGYYAAKSLLQIIMQEKVESKKAQYLIRATKLYDRFLRRALNLEINDAKKIYSKILSDYKIDKNKSIELIYQSFESNDKLNPLKCLSKILNVQETDNFLIDESLGRKIKDLAIFFATIIPVAVTIIQLLLSK